LDTSTPSVSLTFQVSIEDAEVLMAIYAVLTNQWDEITGTGSVSLQHLGEYLAYLADLIDDSAPENFGVWLPDRHQRQLVTQFVHAMKAPEEVRDGSS